MTVQEFYDWCKQRNLKDAEIEISMKCIRRDLWVFPVTKWNIDYGKTKESNEEGMFVRLGG